MRYGRHVKQLKKKNLPGGIVSLVTLAGLLSAGGIGINFLNLEYLQLCALVGGGTVGGFVIGILVDQFVFSTYFRQVFKDVLVISLMFLFLQAILVAMLMPNIANVLAKFFSVD